MSNNKPYIGLPSLMPSLSSPKGILKNELPLSGDMRPSSKNNELPLSGDMRPSSKNNELSPSRDMRPSSKNNELSPKGSLPFISPGPKESILPSPKESLPSILPNPKESLSLNSKDIPPSDSKNIILSESQRLVNERIPLTMSVEEINQKINLLDLGKKLHDAGYDILEVMLIETETKDHFAHYAKVISQRNNTFYILLDVEGNIGVNNSIVTIGIEKKEPSTLSTSLKRGFLSCIGSLFGIIIQRCNEYVGLFIVKDQLIEETFEIIKTHCLIKEEDQPIPYPLVRLSHLLNPEYQILIEQQIEEAKRCLTDACLQNLNQDIQQLEFNCGNTQEKMGLMLTMLGYRVSKITQNIKILEKNKNEYQQIKHISREDEEKYSLINYNISQRLDSLMNLCKIGRILRMTQSKIAEIGKDVEDLRKELEKDISHLDDILYP